MFDKIRSRVATVRSLLGFLWEQRLWWLIPLVVTLLIFGSLLIVAEGSAIAPFIYTLF